MNQFELETTPANIETCY